MGRADRHPVLNKIYLPTADIERAKEESKRLGIDAEDAIPISAKTGAPM